MSKKYSREEVIQILRVCDSGNNGDCDGCPMHGSADCLDYNNERMALEVIEELLDEVKRLRGELILKNNELLKLREENRWIPTSERLPDLDLAEDQSIIDGPWTEVLVMIDGASTATCLYFDGEYFFDLQGDEAISYRVTHWKPMPKGPEAE